MTRSLYLLLFKIILLALFLSAGMSCKKPDNTNRIRPATVLSEEDKYKQQFDVYYNIKKNKQYWRFPAASYMRGQGSQSYSSYSFLELITNYTITIDNSFRRNDTLIYDVLTIDLNDVSPGASYRTFDSNRISARYETGNQYRPVYYRIPASENPNPKTHGFINILSKTSKRVKLDISITTYGNGTGTSAVTTTPHTFKGELEFDPTEGY